MYELCKDFLGRCLSRHWVRYPYIHVHVCFRLIAYINLLNFSNCVHVHRFAHPFATFMYTCVKQNFLHPTVNVCLMSFFCRDLVGGGSLGPLPVQTTVTEVRPRPLVVYRSYWRGSGNRRLSSSWTKRGNRTTVTVKCVLYTGLVLKVWQWVEPQSYSTMACFLTYIMYN